MKKTLLTIIVGGMAFAATNAFANTGTINFNGKVTSATCTINPEVNGTTTSNIDLGQMTSSVDAGTLIDFKLKPEAGSTDCLAKTNARIEWSGPLDTSGYTNTVTGNTAALGYYVAFRATNAGNGSDQPYISISRTAVDYAHTAGIQSFDYTAQLRKHPTAPSGGYKAGMFTTAASFFVTYM
ncbi:fimbrial protein [Salmonella enterica]|nr:fimbrial protein [Salmonella enterica]